MASIRERTGGWQARVTRRGFPSETGTLQTQLAALQWAREIEAQMDRGRYQGRRGADSQLLGQILQRYMEEVSPNKEGRDGADLAGLDRGCSLGHRKPVQQNVNYRCQDDAHPPRQHGHQASRS
jgi:hypothetical protein